MENIQKNEIKIYHFELLTSKLDFLKTDLKTFIDSKFEVL